MTEARLGVVMFKDAPNHIESQPNKLYEYLSASLPVISSNFPLWRNLIEDNNCGICLDPQELDGFVNSIESLIDDEDQLLSMGNNGRHLIETSFNWNVEFKKNETTLYGIKCIMLPFNNILVVAPHTDDGELGAGGLIARAIEEGKRVVYLALSTAAESLPPNFLQTL